MPPVAVIGGGLMGHGIAQVFCEAGFPVSIHDPQPGVLDDVRRRVRVNLQALGREPSAANRIRLASSLESAVSEAQIVFEAIPENLELKQALFEELSVLVAPTAVLATNTSVMSVAAIGERASHRQRVVGTHWWNPPYLVPLVEVVQAVETSATTVRRVIDLLLGVGKVPVHVKRDVPGFVGNRLQHALWRQAFELVDQGVCDPQTIDTVVKQGFGRRLAALGPMENADLIGLDLTLAIHDYVLPTLDPPSRPSKGLRARVHRGDLGMKTGSGYRTWLSGEPSIVQRRVLDHLNAAADRETAS